MRILKVLAAVAALAVPLLGAVPAGAATPGCQAVPAGGCSSWQTPAGGGAALDVWQQRAASDTPVKVYRGSAVDPAEDLELVAVPAGATSTFPSLLASVAPAAVPGTDWVSIEYAPDGIPSGYCVSIIAATERAAAALRPCDIYTASNTTYDPFQVFDKVAATDADGTFYVFKSVLTGFVLNDQRGGGSGSAVISYALGDDGSTPQQLWEAAG